MEHTFSYELEECNAGGWKARFDPDSYADIADRIRNNVELDVDTDHMLLWHTDDTKISFVKSSGVMMVRTDEKEAADQLVAQAIKAE